METRDRLRQIFSESLHIDAAAVQDALAYNSISQWDSVGHMALVAAMESEFDIMLDTNDILDMSSFEKAVEIVETYLAR